MELYMALAIPILFTTAWIYTAQLTRSSLPIYRNKRICLLIAHPDDEAMFFAPTLQALTDPALGNHVKILCLSSGDADGLGEIRKKELQTSALMLGLRAGSDVLIIEDELFPDSMTISWPADQIAKVLSAAFSPGQNATTKKKSRSTSSEEGPHATIDVMITFDKYGISSHPNHISLYHGARMWLSALMADHPGWKCPVGLYTLSTTNIARKYLSFLDAPVSIFLSGLRGAGISKKKRREEPPGLVFVSGLDEWRKAQRAMVQGHQSQMRWFRWGWIGVSRYMVVNDLKRQPVH